MEEGSSSDLLNGTLIFENSESKFKTMRTKKIQNFISPLFFLIALISTFVTIYSLAFTTSTAWSTYQIVVINDVHINRLYNEYGPNPQYDCQNSTEKVEKPYKYGVYKCNPPKILFDSAIDSIKKNVKNPSLIIYGGDSLSYYSSFNDTDFDGMENFLKELFNSIRQINPNVPLIPVIGNNDYLVDYGEISESSGTSYNVSDTQNHEMLARVFSQILSEDELSTLKKGGYYFRDFKKWKLRLIVLDTVYYNKKYHSWDGVPDHEDPYDQLKWYEEKLKEAKTIGLKVGVLMHIPPGISYNDPNGLDMSWDLEHSDLFYNISSKYKISFYLVSHTHYDMFMPMMTSTGEKRTGVYLSSLSISPSHSNNPGYRVYQMKDGKLIDYVQYWADISNNPDNLEWKVEYTFSDVYKEKSITNESLNRILDGILASPKKMWDYQQRFYANANSNNVFYECLFNGATIDEINRCLHEHSPF